MSGILSYKFLLVFQPIQEQSSAHKVLHLLDYKSVLNVLREFRVVENCHLGNNIPGGMLVVSVRRVYIYIYIFNSFYLLL